MSKTEKIVIPNWKKGDILISEWLDEITLKSEIKDGEEYTHYRPVQTYTGQNNLILKKKGK